MMSDENLDPIYKDNDITKPRTYQIGRASCRERV